MDADEGEVIDVNEGEGSEGLSTLCAARARMARERTLSLSTPMSLLTSIEGGRG